jgi:hypothetical protein
LLAAGLAQTAADIATRLSLPTTQHSLCARVGSPRRRVAVENLITAGHQMGNTTVKTSQR